MIKIKVEDTPTNVCVCVCVNSSANIMTFGTEAPKKTAKTFCCCMLCKITIIMNSSSQLK